MRIQILGLNYLPESTSIGPYTADIAEHLQAVGHDVRVTTAFPTAPGWKVWDDYRNKHLMREKINGISVQRTYVYVPANPKKTLQRILFDTSFAASALRSLFTLWKPDVILAVSPPLQLAVTAIVIGILRNAKVFLQIQDLVPDAALATGALQPDSRAFIVGQALEKFVYRKSHGVAVICEGMRRNLLAKGVPPEKVTMIPNSIDLSKNKPVESGEAFRTRAAVAPNKFLALYSGSIAAKQGLQTFVSAACTFSQQSPIVSCIIGDGPYLPELKKLAAESPSSSLIFLPLQPRELLPAQLSAADVLVITQQKSVRDVVFPGKLLYYMAASRPILASVSEDSETGQFIKENEVGLVVPPEDPERLAAALSWLQANPDRARKLGANGRRVVENRFDRTVVLEKFLSYLQISPLSGCQKVEATVE